MPTQVMRASGLPSVDKSVPRRKTVPGRETERAGEARKKFGVFYELQLPRPQQPGDEHRLYQNALNQIELSDKLGYDYAWEVEHHFLEEYLHSPSQESFLAAASQRTKQIRLGHGIYQVTTNYPARMAERIACLDLLLSGCCEFCMGESASTTELEPFGGDTVYAWSEVLEKAEIHGRSDIGALRLRTIAAKGHACEDFPTAGADGKYPEAVILDLDYWVLIPRRGA